MIDPLIHKYYGQEIRFVHVYRKYEAAFKIAPAVII